VRLRYFPHPEDFTAEDADALAVLLRTFPEGSLMCCETVARHEFEFNRPETIEIEKDLREFDWAYRESALRDSPLTMWGMHYMPPPAWVQQARNSAPEGHSYLWSRKLGAHIFIVSAPPFTVSPVCTGNKENQ
jgi:hypothetical protein